MCSRKRHILGNMSRRSSAPPRRIKVGEGAIGPVRMAETVRDAIRRAFYPADHVYATTAEALTWDRFTTDDVYLTRMRQMQKFLQIRLALDEKESPMAPRDLVNQNWDLYWRTLRLLELQQEQQRRVELTSTRTGPDGKVIAVDWTIPPPLSEIIGEAEARSHLSARCGNPKCRLVEFLFVLQFQTSDGESAATQEIWWYVLHFCFSLVFFTSSLFHVFLTIGFLLLAIHIIRRLQFTRFFGGVLLA